MSLLVIDCDFQYQSGVQVRVQLDLNDTVTALVGPSGIGKTTILHLIAGLLIPRSGYVQLHDRVLFDVAKKINIPPERRRVGYLFQDLQLFPHLSVEGNLRFGERRARHVRVPFDRVCQVLQLEELRGRMPNSLSGGQKQRVALGRALLSSPELLLLDEPLSSIGETHRDEVIEFLRHVIDEFQIPAIVVSHDSSIIERMTQSIVHLPPLATGHP